MNEIAIARKSLKIPDIEKIFKVDSKLSPLTIRGYTGSSIQFFEYARALGLPGIEAVNTGTIAKYKQSLIDKGLKNGTINYKLKQYRAFYRQLVKAGKIDTNPTDGLQYSKKKNSPHNIRH